VGGRALPRPLTSLARTLRRNATRAERRLWPGLMREQVAGFRFRRQVILGGFIADFACFDARMVVEVDGATHSTDEKIARDAVRSAALSAQGYDILRFTNEDVFRNLDGVLDTIGMRLAALRPRLDESSIGARRDPPPRPAPQVGRVRYGADRARPTAERAKTAVVPIRDRTKQWSPAPMVLGPHRSLPI
jgi:very-short-patch-repair endonuclease